MYIYIYCIYIHIYVIIQIYRCINIYLSGTDHVHQPLSAAINTHYEILRYNHQAWFEGTSGCTCSPLIPGKSPKEILEFLPRIICIYIYDIPSGKSKYLKITNYS